MQKSISQTMWSELHFLITVKKIGWSTFLCMPLAASEGSFN